ncbi:efflux transporter SaoE [Paraclostridium sordellii]|uniref:efflux transporter SaoE n=1 Tax=Paraclostridium sordellii TaxID=1505 RepID=UPI0005E12E50|nr:efflux transporter SaoE [Paeniclostridium sordellii]MDU6483591.1 efflux transporter SaoE [Paeniclostridium sordellii]CEN84665.1 ABC transporter multidrug-family permease [[Clostridium] sordellii] [Paeniclostridium sordellii]CEN94172.1 ABC transporter multidrug-family permease [[Clostridium] sordellii] [Paeniclostridium sordellii]CEN96176.1 ABC transporter multidrug-family permease [[Clostridium] sordellii] [Paeniclostridium sordellii]CEO13585.1 ABC transporter multidrug-family permease [[Cl
MYILEFFKDVLYSSISILNGASGWLIISFIIAGLLHNLISPQRFQRSLGNTKISSLLKSTVSGMLLPICSCGVIPIGISMYFSGAYLGPVLAFMTSTPIINPIAVILSLGLLGPDVTIIYVIAGFTIPMIVGILGNKLGGPELCINQDEDEEIAIELEEESLSITQKIIEGLKWSFSELALTISKYVVLGMLVAGFITTVFPSSIIQKYLGNPGVLSLGSIAILACIMYVCAVGHIPFIAALVASGASPGVAITFLIAGAATNLPELISMYKVIGKRTVAIYSITLTTCSLIVGYITNQLLMGRASSINLEAKKESINIANTIMLNIPDSMKYLCSFIIFLFFLKAILPSIRKVVGNEA